MHTTTTPALPFGAPAVVNVEGTPWQSALVNVPAVVTGDGWVRLAGEVSSRAYGPANVTRCEGPLPRYARDARGNVRYTV